MNKGLDQAIKRVKKAALELYKAQPERAKGQLAKGAYTTDELLTGDWYGGRSVMLTDPGNTEALAYCCYSNCLKANDPRAHLQGARVADVQPRFFPPRTVGVKNDDKWRSSGDIEATLGKKRGSTDWCVAKPSNKNPQWVIFDTKGELTRVTKFGMIFPRPAVTEAATSTLGEAAEGKPPRVPARGSNPKLFTLQSTNTLTGNWTTLATFTAKPTSGWQQFSGFSSIARYWRVAVYSNYGAESMCVSAFKLFGQRYYYKRWLTEKVQDWGEITTGWW